MKEKKLVIRTFENADVPQLVGAYEWLFQSPGSAPPHWSVEEADARLRRLAGTPSTATVWVVDDSAEILGFCSVYLDIESIRYGRRAWVEDLAVHPQRRSSGIGKTLLDAAKRWAAERGALHLELDSADSRVDAHRFYEREAPTWRSVCFGWQL